MFISSLILREHKHPNNIHLSNMHLIIFILSYYKPPERSDPGTVVLTDPHCGSPRMLPPYLKGVHGIKVPKTLGLLQPPPLSKLARSCILVSKIRSVSFYKVQSILEPEFSLPGQIGVKKTRGCSREFYRTGIAKH